MTRPGLSIALCTYNGEAYLEDQLGSIAAQRLLPDELIVCDDNSTDGTLRILDAFARNSPFPVHIHTNAANVGSNKNFEKATLLCAGDVIALADQDDFWLPEKLSRIVEAFRANPRAGVVFSNAWVVDRNLNSLGTTIWDVFEFTKKRRKQFDSGNAFGVLMRKNVVTGATMAFRRDYTDRIVPFPSTWVHDSWIAFIISLYAKLAYIDEPLVKYRQHPGQQIGAREKSILTREAVFGDNSFSYANEFLRYSQLYTRVKKLRGTVPDYDCVARAVRDKVMYCYSRSHMPRQKRKRICMVGANLFSLRYHRYSYGFLSAAKDLFLENGAR
jgi:glycosyltransferase involved in cell wall biosynthesis